MDARMAIIGFLAICFLMVVVPPICGIVLVKDGKQREGVLMILAWILTWLLTIGFILDFSGYL